MINCNVCGSQLRPSAKFCNICGNTLSSQNITMLSNQPVVLPGNNPYQKPVITPIPPLPIPVPPLQNSFNQPSYNPQQGIVPIPPLNLAPPIHVPSQVVPTSSLSYVKGTVTDVEMASYPEPTNGFLLFLSITFKIIIFVLFFFIWFIVIMFRPSYILSIFGFRTGGRQPKQMINVISLQVRDAAMLITPVAIYNPTPGMLNINDQVEVFGRPYKGSLRANQVKLTSRIDKTTGQRVYTNIIIEGK